MYKSWTQLILRLLPALLLSSLLWVIIILLCRYALYDIGE